MPIPARAKLLRVGLPALLAALSLSGCITPSMLDPDPFPVASSRARTDSAIRDGLRREGWEVEKWSSGEAYARTTLDGLSVRVRIVSDEIEARISWIDIPSPLGDSPEQIAERKKVVRRALRSLADRIEYYIESADL